MPKDARVTLKRYDLLGREIMTLVDEVKDTGNYHVQWNGDRLPSGVDFYKLTTGNKGWVKKMVVVR